MKKYSSFFLAIVLFIGLLSFTIMSIGDDVLEYTNAFRKENGLAQLQSNEVLNKIAQQHSRNMASGKVKFGHAGFNARNASAAKQIAGLRYFAENVAYGPVSGEEVVNLWKNSQGHRKNMLGNFSMIGIGVARSKDGTYYYTQVFGN
ncbi:MAG: CAP domain-containing protein [Ferruginibacter sp.]